MKKNIRLLSVIVGLALATASGSAFAQADHSDVQAKTQSAWQGQGNNHTHHCRHNRHCNCNNSKEHRRNWDHRERFAELAKKLDLSDQQKAQMKEIFKNNQPQVKPIFTKLINEKREMRTLIQLGSADEATIRAQAAKVAGVEADLAVQRSHMVKQLRAILTPEQIEKFKSVQKEREVRFDKFRERMNERFDEPGTGK